MLHAAREAKLYLGGVSWCNAYGGVVGRCEDATPAHAPQGLRLLRWEQIPEDHAPYNVGRFIANLDSGPHSARKQLAVTGDAACRLQPVRSAVPFRAVPDGAFRAPHATAGACDVAVKSSYSRAGTWTGEDSSHL